MNCERDAQEELWPGRLPCEDFGARCRWPFGGALVGRGGGLCPRGDVGVLPPSWDPWWWTSPDRVEYVRALADGCLWAVEPGLYTPAYVETAPAAGPETCPACRGQDPDCPVCCDRSPVGSS